ncbi:Ferredoxin-thioredoxin reductase, variable chain [Frankliniella fusca]|uniref:Ferredoxin-thioredoxin reductase, variable chain n=1 Tax=Frankliniella fusca TaxID=407009 RepID=A0AAE1H9Z9_9NEOP|nr:Ferredoxin-thioredoxin reductase, variable chain [Frankliniella fusca]
MEKGTSVSDPHQEQVRKLQEKVRELEFQLSKKSSTLSRNGISEASNSTNNLDTEGDEGLVPVYDVDLSPKTWLVSGRGDPDPRPEHDIFAALLSEGALLEKTLYAAIRSAEQDQRKNIDTRTFTRPKKRVGRPSLEILDSLSCLPKAAENGLSWAKDANCTELDNMTCSLLESSLINSVYSADASTANDISSQLSVVNKKQKITPQLERRRGSLVISDSEINLEDIKPHFKHDNGNSFSNHFENVNFGNLESVKNDIRTQIANSEEMDTTLLESTDITTSLIESALMDANLMDSVVIKSKSKLATSRIHQMNRTFTPSPPTVSNDTLEPNKSLNNLNETFVKEDDSSPGRKDLNNTFSVETNGSCDQRTAPPLARPGSTDSGGADDDQLSSTSESSLTSTTRLLSVGDVQHIARLQEQSLVVSTPSHRHIARLIDNGEDNLSPILADWNRSSGGSEIPTGGYLSDHSSRSPLSSLHSSPTGSPFGSSTVLHGPTQGQDTRLSHRPNGVLQRKNTYGLIPPKKANEGGMRPPAPVTALAKTAPSLARPTTHSGLRPSILRPPDWSRSSGGSEIPTGDTRLSHRPNGVLQRKDTESSIPPRKVAEGAMGPPAPVTVSTKTAPRIGRPTARSGLRPPMIRTGASGSSGLPRPSGTGIPRPSSLSRIPPPKVRSSVSQAPRKEWTDECF